MNITNLITNSISYGNIELFNAPWEAAVKRYNQNEIADNRIYLKPFDNYSALQSIKCSGITSCSLYIEFYCSENQLPEFLMGRNTIVENPISQCRIIDVINPTDGNFIQKQFLGKPFPLSNNSYISYYIEVNPSNSDWWIDLAYAVNIKTDVQVVV